MRLTLFETVESLAGLADEWSSLLPRSYSNRIFSTYDWNLIWWQSYLPGELMVMAAYGDDGVLIGIAPWFIHAHEGERVLRTIGCVDVTDYVDLIIDRSHIYEVSAAFATFAFEQRGRFDRMNLCNIPEDSPTLSQFVSHLQQSGFTIECVEQEVCPIIRLPQDFEAYLESLDKKQRHELRRKMRRADGDGDKMDWYIVQEGRDFQTELASFIRLMEASQPAKAEFMANPQNRTFMSSMARVMYEKGWLQLAMLTINDEASAAYLNFDYDGTIQVYNSGLLPDKYGHLSPGIVLIANVIQQAIETKHHTLDFLRGNEVYKYRLGAVDTRVLMLKAHFSV